MYFGPYMYGLVLYVHAYMDSPYTKLWAAHMRMGCPCTCGTDLLNCKFIHDLICSWIKEHLNQARIRSQCAI